jgi:hypothetical protein
MNLTQGEFLGPDISKVLNSTIGERVPRELKVTKYFL